MNTHSVSRVFGFIAVGVLISLSPALMLECCGKGAPTAPKAQFTKPPEGAIVLFDGKDASAWTHYDGGPIKWKIGGGAMTVVPKTGDIRTKRTFGDQRLHIEFMCPPMPDAKGQGKGNSGVYLQGLYEIQVLDSHGLAKPGKGDCGALYDCYPPKVNACLPAGQWQSYDIWFKAPRFDETGKMVANGRITAVHNGIMVQENAPLRGPTRAHMKWDPTKPGPLMLQDHGDRVAYRNVWVLPYQPPARADVRAEVAQAAVDRTGPMSKALKLYRLCVGTHPTSEQGLRALVEKPKQEQVAKKWTGPYIEKLESLNDPWDTPLRYRFPGLGDPKTFELWSAGPDRQSGTLDDVWPE